MKNIQLIRQFMTRVHDSKSGNLCQSHFCLHYIVAFIWDQASFHNYIMETLNLLFFIHPLTQKCRGIVSKELQMHLNTLLSNFFH